MDAYGVWKQEGADWDDSPAIWEWQHGPRLTVGELAERLSGLDPKLPLLVTFEGGRSTHPVLVPVELGCTGPGDEAPVVLLTVAPFDEK